MKKTIIVMPVANEEDTMEKILDEILALPYDNLYIYPVIDSYSKDRTEEIIRRKAACNDRVKCIFYRESRGVISCYLEAICLRRYRSFLQSWKKGMTVCGDPVLWRAVPCADSRCTDGS